MAWFSQSKVKKFLGWWVSNILFSDHGKKAVTSFDKCLTSRLILVEMLHKKNSLNCGDLVICSEFYGCVLPGPTCPGASHHLGSGHPGWSLWSQWQWSGQSYWNIQRDGTGHLVFPAVVCSTVHVEEQSHREIVFKTERDLRVCVLHRPEGRGS
jgi:hypothetical protein